MKKVKHQFTITSLKALISELESRKRDLANSLINISLNRAEVRTVQFQIVGIVELLQRLYRVVSSKVFLESGKKFNLSFNNYEAHILLSTKIFEPHDPYLLAVVTQLELALDGYLHRPLTAKMLHI